MMKKLLSLFLVLLTLSVSAQTVTVTGVYDYSEAKAFVRAINKSRMKKKLNTLKMDHGLTEAAMIRAAEMKDISEMTHTRPNNCSGHSIITYQQYGESSLASENIAHGQETASKVVSQWMTFPGPRAAILDERCNRMGAGECDGYWVQLFVRTKEKKPVLSKSAA